MSIGCCWVDIISVKRKNDEMKEHDNRRKKKKTNEMYSWEKQTVNGTKDNSQIELMF